jgi:hypothetical protein
MNARTCSRVKDDVQKLETAALSNDTEAINVGMRTLVKLEKEIMLPINDGWGGAVVW